MRVTILVMFFLIGIIMVAGLFGEIYAPCRSIPVYEMSVQQLKDCGVIDNPLPSKPQ